MSNITIIQADANDGNPLPTVVFAGACGGTVRVRGSLATYQQGNDKELSLAVASVTAPYDFRPSLDGARNDRISLAKTVAAYINNPDRRKAINAAGAAAIKVRKEAYIAQGRAIPSTWADA